MESTTPQPGRIPPIQKAGGGGSVSKIAEIAKNPKGAIAEGAVNKVTAGVTQHFADKDNQNRYRKALKKARNTERAPVFPQYRLSLWEGGLLIGVSAVVDVADWVAGLFFEVAIGEIIVLIIDIIYGILLFCYCRFRLKLPVAAHGLMYFSILGAELVNMIPFVNATWWLDAWYIVHVVRAEDRRTHQQLLQTIEEDKQEQRRQNFMEDFARQQAQEEAGNNASNNDIIK